VDNPGQPCCFLLLQYPQVVWITFVCKQGYPRWVHGWIYVVTTQDLSLVLGKENKWGIESATCIA
jgi:hypothetical protein